MNELESALNYLLKIISKKKKIISKLEYLIIRKGLLITYLTWNCEDALEQMKYCGSQD